MRKVLVIATSYAQYAEYCRSRRLHPTQDAVYGDDWLKIAGLTPSRIVYVNHPLPDIRVVEQLRALRRYTPVEYTQL